MKQLVNLVVVWCMAAVASSDKPCTCDLKGQKWAEWMPWIQCYTLINTPGRWQDRMRLCMTDTKIKVACTGSEKQSCRCPSCKVDGLWTSWGTWSACSKSCGRGTQTRRRSCSNPTPSNGGRLCIGRNNTGRFCNTDKCPVDGGWTSWERWSSCSNSCGGGGQSRSRSCNNPSPENGGKRCSGTDRNYRGCSNNECPVDGGWTPWERWSTCSKSCRRGSQSRSRSCSKPSPAHGGQQCNGAGKDYRDCNKKPCPVDGIWTTWGPWSSCSVTCGGGTQTRNRSCSNPKPVNGGKPCSGDKTDQRTCTAKACPVDGKWTTWNSWSSCSVTCGEGKQIKNRSCSNPKPSNGGKSCSGDETDDQTCKTKACPVDGIWTTWDSWSVCSITCGEGTQYRNRSCNNPKPSNGGKPCNGSIKLSRTCETEACPVTTIRSTTAAPSKLSTVSIKPSDKKTTTKVIRTSTTMQTTSSGVSTKVSIATRSESRSSKPPGTASTIKTNSASMSTKSTSSAVSSQTNPIYMSTTGGSETISNDTIPVLTSGSTTSPSVTVSKTTTTDMAVNQADTGTSYLVLVISVIATLVIVIATVALILCREPDVNVILRTRGLLIDYGEETISDEFVFDEDDMEHYINHPTYNTADYQSIT